MGLGVRIRGGAGLAARRGSGLFRYRSTVESAHQSIPQPAPGVQNQVYSGGQKEKATGARWPSQIPVYGTEP